METTTLAQVRRSMAAGKTNIFGPIPVYVVNFDAPLEYPRKFVYQGCTSIATSGRTCAKYFQATTPCPHKMAVGTIWAPMYRFDVFMVDYSVGCLRTPPLRATLFGAPASNLVGVGLSEFNEMNKLEQIACVHHATSKMNVVDVVIRTKGGQSIVQSMSAITIMGVTANSSSPCNFHTSIGSSTSNTRPHDV
ncbi:unnamed protein product [Calypogeia fissa]